MAKLLHKKLFTFLIFSLWWLETFARKPKRDLYENPAGNIMLGVIFVILGLIIFYFIRDRYQKSVRKNEFFSFENLKPYIIAFSLLFGTLLIVNLFLRKPTFSDPKEKIEYGKHHGYSQYMEEGYRELTRIYTENEFTRSFFQRGYADLKKVSQNLDDHEGYIKAFFKNHIYEMEVGQLLIDYEKIPHDEVRHFSEGVLFFEMNRFDQARTSFDSLEKSNLRKVQYYHGLMAKKEGDYQTAIPFFEKEINNQNGFVSGAYKEIINIVYYREQWDNIASFYENEETRKYMPYHVKTHHLYRSGNFLSLFQLYFSHYIKKFDPLGSIAALLVALVWLIYLIRLNFLKITRYTTIAITFIIGAILPFSVWYISDFINYTIDFTLTGGLLNDLFYCIFSIGLVEEIIKVIPFLIALKLHKGDKQPYDYILYACIAALGFAFIENTIYYTQDKLHIVHSRALVSVFAHMFDATLVAYGIILAKYKLKKPVLPYFMLFLLLASVAHGLFDFFLINDDMKSVYLITFLIYLISIHMWADMRSNALNQSAFFNYNLLPKLNGLQFFLVSGLLGILMFEYLIMGFKFGNEVANDKLIDASLSGGYLIVYLALSLGRVDLIQSYWKPISLPLKLSYYLTPKIINPQHFIGLKLELKAAKYNTKLNKILPAYGEIVDRKILNATESWFQVDLERSFLLGKSEVNSVLIKFYYNDANPKEHENLRILVRAAKDTQAYDGLLLDKSKFALLGWAFTTKT